MEGMSLVINQNNSESEPETKEIFQSYIIQEESPEQIAKQHTPEPSEEKTKKKNKKSKPGRGIWLFGKRKKPKPKKPKELQESTEEPKPKKQKQKTMPPHEVLIKVESANFEPEPRSERVKVKPNYSELENKSKRKVESPNVEAPRPERIKIRIKRETENKRKPESSNAELESTSEQIQEKLVAQSYILVDEKKILETKCDDLNNINKQLAAENIELRKKLESFYQTESKSVQQKQITRTTAALQLETLLDIWGEVSSLQIPDCLCSKIPTAVSKKRTHPKNY